VATLQCGNLTALGQLLQQYKYRLDMIPSWWCNSVPLRPGIVIDCWRSKRLEQLLLRKIFVIAFEGRSGSDERGEEAATGLVPDVWSCGIG